MQVNYPGTITIPKAYSNVDAHRPSRAAGSDSVGKTGKMDSVTLSDTTRQLQKVSASMDIPQKNRAEKINSLKHAVAQGEYKVVPEKVAEKILNTFMG